MYNSEIEEMTGKIQKTLKLNDKDAERVTKVLQNHWKDSISITWKVCDIIDRAKENHIKLTQEQAREVLESLEDNHDCNYGITWDMIDDTINDVK
jgi:hypothetical protein